VNTSMVFSALWSVVSNFVAEGTRAKVHVFSWADADNMRAKLREACGAECLPKELGGQMEAAEPYHAQM
jgi:hypothetical protein